FLGTAWGVSPSYILLLLANALLGGGKIFCNVLLPKFLIDELTGGRRVEWLLLWGGSVVATNVLLAFFANLLRAKLETGRLRLTQGLQQALAHKVMNCKYELLEDPHYLDLKERANFACSNQDALTGMIREFSDLLKNLATMLGLAGVLLTLSVPLVLVLVCCIAVMMAIYGTFVNYQLTFFEGIIPFNRKLSYYMGFAYDELGQQDVRLYDLPPMLGERARLLNLEIIHAFTHYAHREGLHEGINSVLTVVQSLLAYLYVGARVLTTWFGPSIGLGSFTMYVAAATGFSAATATLGQNVLDVIRHLGYLDPFLELMELDDEDGAAGTVPLVGEVESICFEHVSFHYPRTEALVLNDLSFSIAKGEKISIVGLNGAGKTTLIKLLCRLYQPTSGRILVNGQDIAQYEHQSYLAQLAAVFQDFKLFAFSIAENVSCGTAGDGRDTAALLEQVGLGDKLRELPAGQDTLLGKAYDKDGIDLSGGQKQKIAIARALYKRASLIILDEPTSALDPLAEAEIYRDFNRMTGGKTAIYISHRMSSSVFCDRILVLDDGRVVDFASHDALMEQGDSLYCRLFRSQAENYKL
ncbi:MAG: ABC transporter ATP-binding protein, partial [Angelakisella sp.]